jgi:cytochrome c556
MIRYPTRGLIAATAMFALLAACDSPATEGTGEGASAAAEPAVIEQRQSNFKGIGDAFKVIRTQLETDAPDFAAIEAAAITINENAQKVGGYFPEGTGMDAGYDTEALATIWEKPAEFETATQNFVLASAEMVTLASGGDAAAIGAHVGELGKTCKGCHDEFRVEDD